MQLFSESAARALVSLPGSSYSRFAAICADEGVEVHRLGEVISDPAIDIVGQFIVELSELRARWSSAIPEAMGE